MPADRVKGEALARLRRHLTRPSGEAAGGRGPEGLKMMVIHKG